MNSTKCYPSAIEMGNNIRKWRLVKNFKQDLFAEKLNISRVALSRIETGKTDITLSRLCEIAKILHIDVTVLFSEVVLIR